MQKKYIWFFAVTLLLFFLSAPVCMAAETASNKPPVLEYMTATVLTVEAGTTSDAQAQRGLSMTWVKVKITSGPEKGQDVLIMHRAMAQSFHNINAQPGDSIVLVKAFDNPIRPTYSIADYQRGNYLVWLIGAFVLMLLIFGRGVGLRSIVVIAASLGVLYYGFIGQVLTGSINIIVLTFLCSAVIASITLFSVGGKDPKTWAAFGGTLGGIAAAAILASLSVHWMHLTGLANEEAMLLKATTMKHVDFQGLLFAGIVFGALGAIMDVAISIASAQQEVCRNCPTLSRIELLRSGMAVGRDVMATDANTLILAYAGSSLPLVLLIASQPDLSLFRVMNLDLIVTEFVRALAGSIGLILSIPLTALTGAFLLTRKSSE